MLLQPGLQTLLASMLHSNGCHWALLLEMLLPTPMSSPWMARFLESQWSYGHFAWHCTLAGMSGESLNAPASDSCWGTLLEFAH